MREDSIRSPSDALEKFGHEARQADEVITAVRRRAEHHWICLQRPERIGEQCGRQSRAITANDDGRWRTLAKAVGKCASHPLAEVSVALFTTKPAVAEPVTHFVFVITGKTNFQFHFLQLTQSVGGSERAENQPTMQRRRAFRAQRRNETCLHFPSDGKAGEQNQSASLFRHG